VYAHLLHGHHVELPGRTVALHLHQQRTDSGPDLQPQAVGPDSACGEAEVTEPVEGAGPLPPDRPAEAAAVLRELLRLADVPATLDVKDTADGSISIALQLGVELPGVMLGRRGTFVDALQFLVNKLTHRPGSERRWVSLGVGEHPPPRGPRPPRNPPGAAQGLRPTPASRPVPAEAVPAAVDMP